MYDNLGIKLAQPRGLKTEDNTKFIYKVAMSEIFGVQLAKPGGLKTKDNTLFIYKIEMCEVDY